MVNISNLQFFNESSGAAATAAGNGSSGGSIAKEPSTEAIIVSAILSVFSVLGTVGNALAFLIYYRKRDKGTSTIFILSLAVADFLNCLVMIPYTIATELLVYRHTYDIVCKLYMLLQTAVIPLSSLIMVAIGIDRYFCICHPFMRAVTVPRAKVILVILTLVSLALGIVPSLGHSVYQLEAPSEVITYVNHTTSDLTDSLAVSALGSAPNSSLWVRSLSDAALPSVTNGAPFSYAPSPPPNYVSAATSLLPLSLSEAGSTTLSPPELYTNGLFLEPEQDFLDAIQGKGSQTTPAPGPASGLTTASLLNNSGGGVASTTALDSNIQNVTTVVREIRSMQRKLIYYGYCYRSEVIITINFVDVYQKFYAALYLVEFVILALLYILIYRSILVRRAWKAKRKRMSCYASTEHGPAEETQLTHISAHHVNNSGPPGPDANGSGGGNAADKDGQASAETVLLNPKKKDPAAGRVSAAMRDRAFYANIKTAAMLFVVTLGFVVSFLPSWLMGLRVISFNMIVFYMFYINNVINPFIYAFMNRTFRDDLVTLIKGFCRR